MCSPETHAGLIARIPAVTGRDLPHWLAAVDSGPSLLRRDERAQWLAGEHELPPAYAGAIVREHELRRAARRR
jgi:hypothetical protein